MNKISLLRPVSLTLLAGLLLLGGQALAADVKPTYKPRPAFKPVPIPDLVLADGTVNLFGNGDLRDGLSGFTLHGNTMNVVSVQQTTLPDGLNVHAIRYLKTASIPEEDYHFNHRTTVPTAGVYIVSYWCRTTAPLIPMICVRKNWRDWEIDPQKLFQIRNDGTWQRYEHEFTIDDTWPNLTFVMEFMPGTKSLNLVWDDATGEFSNTDTPHGYGSTGETWFADIRLRKK